MDKIYKNRYIESVIIITLLILCEYFFFRNILGNGQLIGDRGDGRLTNLLVEHWWQVLLGKENFTELSMFHPAAGILGYSDMLFGYGGIYAIFRALHFDMYISYKITLILIHCLGSFGMYYLLRKKFSSDALWAFFGTLAFSFSSTYARHFDHTQLAAISLLPFLVILLMGFIKNFQHRKKRNIYAFGFISAFALLTYTSWYVAFFAGFFSLVFIILYAIKSLIYKISLWQFVKEKVSIIGVDMIGYIAYLTIIYIPFIMIYLPVLRSSNGWGYSGVCVYLPEAIDLINVAESNLLLGWLMKILSLAKRGYSGEVEEGFSTILLSLFFVVCFSIKKYRLKRQNLNYKTSIENASPSRSIYTELVPECICLSIIICALLIIRLSSNGVSLWYFVYQFLPVARSIRAVSRLLLWLSFPMSLIVALYVPRIIRFKNKFLVNCFVIMLISLLFISNIDKRGVATADYNRNQETAFISNIAKAPEDMEAFYIIDTGKTGSPAHIYQLDAFEIAACNSYKTINGYSGQMPVNWMGIWDVTSSSYERHVFNWIRSNNLTNVYAYDRGTNTWVSSEKRMSNIIKETFCPLKNSFSLSHGLMDHNQGDFAWTSKVFDTVIKNPRIQKSGLLLKIRTELVTYQRQTPNEKFQITLYIDDQYVRELPVINGYAEYRILLPEHINDVYRIGLKTNAFFNPSELGDSGDTRNLSIAVYYIGD